MNRPLAAWLGLLICAILATAVQAAETNGQAAPPVQMNLPAYVAELDAWRAKLEVAEKVSWQEDLAALPSHWSVQWQGQSFSIETGWINAGLRPRRTPEEAEAARNGVLTHLQALREAARAMDSQENPFPSDAHPRLDAILSRKEFSAVHAPTIWDHLRRQLNEWVMIVMDKIFGGFHRYPNAGGLLIWAAIVALLSVLVLWLRRTWKRSAGIELDLPEPLPSPRDWRDWAREAAAAASAGDYRQAVHAAYWAGIQRLESLGTWTSDTSRTPREYLRLVPPGHQHNPALEALTRRFEAVWYANRPTDAAQFGEYVCHLETLGCRFPWTQATARS